MERVFHLCADARFAVFNTLHDLLLRAIFHFFDGAAPCSNSQCREAVATSSKTLAKPRVTGIGIDWFLAVPQELLGYRYVRLVGRGGHHAVDRKSTRLNSDMGFHAEKPLVAFSSLLH